MNIVNQFFLRLILLPSGLYRKMGVNTHHLKAILQAKLIMDDRRPNSFQQTRFSKQGRTINLATLGTMALAAFMGFFFLVSFVVGQNYITKLTTYFSFYVFILASTLISDFTSVLLDVRDNTILLPKPVNGRSLVFARLLHIIIHVSKIVLPMTLPGIIYMGYHQGLGAVGPFLLMILAATLFTIFLINAVYLLILKITTPEKFKNIISYFQILFTIFVYGGYQLIPNLYNRSHVENIDITHIWWAWLFPPYWFAGGYSFLIEWHFTIPLIICLALSILTPWLSIWLVIHYFAPSFNQQLAQISGSSEMAPVVRKNKAGTHQSSRYAERIAILLTRKGAERVGFLHAWKMMIRSRDFKMKVYPAFGYLIVMFVVLFLGNQTGQHPKPHALRLKELCMMAMYFSCFILIVAVQQIVYSEQYKASWMFVTTPIQKPGQLISGAVKAVTIQFFMPLASIIVIAAIILVGPAFLINLSLGFCNMLTFVALLAYITIKELPFSQLQSTSSKTGQFLRNMFTMLIVALVAFLHFMVYQYLIVVLILFLLSAIAYWLLMDAIKEKDWAKVRILVNQE
ncbi:hypothetical protein SAMN05444410_10127 [Hydrobacter penzbergensis]|uniref:Uncharacterized protein n=1 Tax=Hydrobacter penzbergensis TaxID=1235997 RepID=A0A8X8I8A2_9BACT|nr:hypothetical protein [Hydrobacter penzbergensis]SDW01968.1 hypothetical protein SAMN05444410_10127 [Hydrobacter penzbergensis]